MPHQDAHWVDASTGRWVLTATILASSMAFIDSTALNVALPTLQSDLQATGTQVLWVVNAYNLLLAALILVGGALGDRYGRKRLFGIGIGGFAAASLACGLSPSPAFLIGARAVQGIGGALMVPGSLSIITASFAPEDRGRAIGTWSAFSTITTIIGPFLGGALAQVGFWRGVFFLNLPLAAIAMYAVVTHVPATRDTSLTGAPDWPGALAIFIGLGGMTYAFTEANERTWSNPLIWVMLGVGVLGLAAFLLIESRRERPMLPLHLFENQTFTAANLLTFFLYAALYGVTVFLPLNLVQIQGYSQIGAGLAMLPFSILLAGLSRFTGDLVTQTGPRLLLTVGPLIVAGGMALFAVPGVTAGPGRYWLTFFPPAVVFGLGMSLVVAPLTTTVMSALPERYSGTASGVNNAISRTGGVLATAILGAVMLSTFQSSLVARTTDLLTQPQVDALRRAAADLGNTQIPDRIADPQVVAQIQTAIDHAFVSGFRTITLIGAGLAVISAAFAFFVLPRTLPATEDENASPEPSG